MGGYLIRWGNASRNSGRHRLGGLLLALRLRLDAAIRPGQCSQLMHLWNKLAVIFLDRLLGGEEEKHSAN